jgi:hypothetical protein
MDSNHYKVIQSHLFSKGPFQVFAVDRVAGKTDGGVDAISRLQRHFTGNEYAIRRVVARAEGLAQDVALIRTVPIDNLRTKYAI